MQNRRSLYLLIVKRPSLITPAKRLTIDDSIIRDWLNQMN
jgi:hypothetical protein